MLLEAFFTFVAERVATASKWLKAYFSDEKGQTKDASPENISRYGKIRASGDVNITNISLNLVADQASPEFSKEELREILAEIANQISSHSGLALGLDENFITGIESRVVSPVTEVQKNQVKVFTEAGWKRDKINSIITAYRIINAEDAGKFVEAKQLLDSASKGRKRVLNRKMYNLARAGYLERFAFDLLFSAQYKGDENISGILDYFPDAIFLDQDFLEEDLNIELLRREKEGVRRVSVYARNRRRIEIMEIGYHQYLRSKVELEAGETGNKRALFMIEKKMAYTLGDSEAETMDLRFRELIIKEFKDPTPGTQ